MRTVLSKLHLRLRSERGEVAILVVSMMMMVMLLFGLIVEGGSRIKARNQADAYASEAARYATSKIGANGNGQKPTPAQLDTACREAEAYLSAAGVSGYAVPNGIYSIKVTVTIYRSSPLLPSHSFVATSERVAEPHGTMALGVIGTQGRPAKVGEWL